MAASERGPCLSLWREQNDGLARRWLSGPRGVGRPAALPPFARGRLPSCRQPPARLLPWQAAASPGRESQAAPQCPRAFRELLQKIQGLPAVLPALPLELTILCNSLLLDIGLCSDSSEKLLARIDHGLSRVLEAHSVPEQGLRSEDRWQKVLQLEIPEELRGPLHQLAALQGLLWLAASRLEQVEGLFQQLCSAENLGLPWHSGSENKLLPLLRGWHPPDFGDAGPLVVQSARDLKGVLCTSAAFLQGFQELGAGRHPEALAFLQAAATGLCRKRVLAQIFTLMGCCNLKMGKPQAAIQCLKRALQVDSSFLPALYHAALLYRHLGLTEAELEALALLYQALDGPAQMAAESLHPPCLVGVEHLTCTAELRAFFGQTSPADVKYLLAQRCLQAGRAQEAAEHYLDLLALWQEGPLQQGFLHGELVMPRTPEVFLEAASALEEVARHHDAIAVSEEVVMQTSKLIPRKLQIDVGSSTQEDSPWPTGSPAWQERESLRCILWRAAAYLLQGCAWARLGEAKEAISLLTRCLHDLLRIHFINPGSSSIEEGMARFAPAETKALPQVRQLALMVRGVEFLELGRHKEALMDFQHSLHFCPDSPAASLYLVRTLWELGRRQEAAACWQKLRTSPLSTEEEASRPSPQYLRLCRKWMEFPDMESLAKNLETCLPESEQASWSC